MIWALDIFLRKEDNDCMKKCMEYEVEGSRPRGRPKRTWREIVKKDCQACKLLSSRLAVTPAILKKAAANFAAW